ncbi:P-loop containing nucleoside triphosphate hydrolase protein [Gorgonomyces haynaldii]|nr:P-loop containing nucleoside triphosphate hydrolase protein [Gorgonomyces haynaldii]
MQNKLDIAYFCLFLIRYALLVVLAITAKSYLSRLSTGPISSWQDMWQKTKKLFPFLWPKGIKLQLLVIACFGLLAAGRIVNVLVPYTYKLLVEDLTPGTQDKPKKPFFAWGAILLYTLLRFFQGGVGLLSSLQYFLWIPVSQYTTREICVQMLRHLHSLSLDFHIKRKTGEVLRVMDRGTASIGSLLSYIAFNILPVFVDIGLAVIYFVFAFDWLVAMIVFVTMILYIFFTVWITEWRTKFRREMNDLDSSARGRAVDSLLNFETVKYFGNEHWEVKEYEKAILDYQVADWKSSSSLNLLNTAQNTVITLGLMAGLLLTAQRVVSGDLTVGDFVAFITYLLQLYQPLNWFGTYYRVIQQNFIDMEKMLDLFEEHVAVQDAPDARPLVLKQGNIAFNDVSFKYTHEQDNDTLSNVSFTVPAGKTVAIVGASGGGKSTILRLLFRFYDINSGSIQIDGQDIRQVTQQSLRKAIGVVPQDTVLFNDTVRFNIRYGNVDATDEQVEQAAKAAQIHDRIMSFPDGYDTKVGERGLRLSGGEKQRIAIARTLLKNPSIILLDEATSALDNQTERQIQQQLSQVFKDRTTIVIAHRLSTIVDADEILVLRDGVVVQRGVHRELVTQTNGVYYKMWTRQLEQPK